MSDCDEIVNWNEIDSHLTSGEDNCITDCQSANWLASYLGLAIVEIKSQQSMLTDLEGKLETLRYAFDDRVRVIKLQLEDKERLEGKLEKAKECLEFYADPESYHALLVLGDSPCGGFIDDVSEDYEDDFYEVPMAGAKARATLKQLKE